MALARDQKTKNGAIVVRSVTPDSPAHKVWLLVKDNLEDSSEVLLLENCRNVFRREDACGIVEEGVNRSM